MLKINKNKILNIILLLPVILSLLFFCLPSLADQHNGIACNHNTGECYDADVEPDFGYVTIYFKDSKVKTLDLDDDYPDDPVAYDKEGKVYYDIEVLTRQ